MLIAIMLIIIMLIVIMLIAIMLIVIMLIVIMLIVIMLIFIYADFHLCWFSFMLWRNRKLLKTLGVMLWMNLGNLKSDFSRIIRLRLYSGPSGCRVPS